MEKASHEGVVVRGPSPSRQVVDRVVSEPLGISSVRFEGQISTFRTACSSSERVVGVFLNITGSERVPLTGIHLEGQGDQVCCNVGSIPRNKNLSCSKANGTSVEKY